jgi:hypothetical protein
MQYDRNSVNISPHVRTGTAATAAISNAKGSFRDNALYATEGRYLKKNRRI